MKKKCLTIFFIIIASIICWFWYVDRYYTDYNLILQGTVVSNNGKDLLIEGFPQNPIGRRGKYRIRYNSKIAVYDIDNSPIEFGSLKMDDIIVVHYRGRVLNSKIESTNDMNLLLVLKDNQRISRIVSITKFIPPLQHDVIPN